MFDKGLTSIGITKNDIVYFLFLQFGQAFYGFFFSAEVALFGYLYAMVEEKEFYQKITGHARAATLTGKFFSSCLSQILATYYGTPPFNALVYMSIFGKYTPIFLLIHIISIDSLKLKVFTF